MSHMKFTLLTFALFLSIQLSAQGLWQPIKIEDIKKRSLTEYRILPTKFDAYKLDAHDLGQRLAIAPSEEIAINMTSDVIIDLPMEDGTLRSFYMYESPVMAPALAEKYSSIKTYKGVCVDNKLINVRLDITPEGFHAAIHAPQGIFYIDPYDSDLTAYLAYNVKDDQQEETRDIPLCGNKENGKPHLSPLTVKTQTRSVSVPLRKYRLAIATTGEFGEWKGSPEKTMSDIVTGLNRMNQVFENEASIRYELIADNDKLFHYDPTSDPYTNTASGSSMLGLNTNVIAGIVGLNAFDLGHVYSTGCDVGGVAALGSLCNQQLKGAGVTCFYGSDINFFAVSVTAHEIGHQMAASHTFNHCNGGNESLGTGFEPGSGSTIMSYAGLCGDRNVQDRADDYYHTGSLVQIYNHTRAGIADNCGEKIDFNNHEPVIAVSDVFEKELYIPTSTYFFLEGSATDEDGDTLTYAWDGMNTGPLSPLGAPLGSAPHFRAYKPSTSSTRYVPNVLDIFNNRSTKLEVLPDEDMEILFNLTVRDNHWNGGTAVWERVSFDVVKTQGTFGFTGDADGGNSYTVGDEVEVTWDVAGTDQKPIDAPLIDIYFYEGKAQDFDINNLTILEKGVPNDGSQKVRLPDMPTEKGRFVIKASDNIFFDISIKNIQVQATEEAKVYGAASPLYIKSCLPDVVELNVYSTAREDISGEVKYDITGLPEGTIYSFVPATSTVGDTVTLTLDFSDVLVTDILQPDISVIYNGADTTLRSLTLDLVASDFSDLGSFTPDSGSKGLAGAPIFAWSDAQFAERYDFELSPTPTFDSLIFNSAGSVDTFFTADQILDKNAIYYWRVKPSNNCGTGAYAPTQVFSTALLACEQIEAANLPLSITQSGTPEIEVEFNVLTNGVVSDVNIPNFKGDHTRNKDLSVKVVSPSGKEVVLFENICSQQNFNCSFDDESNKAVKCPLSKGDVYRPKQELANFNGEASLGVWKLNVKDTKAGNGGKLTKASIEICSQITVSDPELVNLNTVKAPTNNTQAVGPWHLLVTDTETDADGLVYKILSLPELGTLENQGIELAIGSTFTQNDINSLSLNYISSDKEGSDNVALIVEDGQGGWIGVLDLAISINGSNPVSTEEEELDNSVNLVPNPASNSFSLQGQIKDIYSLTIYDLQGRLLLEKNDLSHDTTVDIKGLSTGMYIVRGQDVNGTSFTKLLNKI